MIDAAATGTALASFNGEYNLKMQMIAVASSSFQHFPQVFGQASTNTGSLS
jgi:hypothetical protein